MDAPRPLEILFLCTGNSARSILAEYIMRRVGRGRFVAHSAGSKPKGAVHPMALEVLHDLYRMDITDARSKSWDEFREVKFDFVVTLCESAKESCPLWQGQPVQAHWGSPDPAAFEGTEAEKLAFFKQVAMQIQRRIELLCCLPFDKLVDHLQLTRATKEIGEKEKINTAVPNV